MKKDDTESGGSPVKNGGRRPYKSPQCIRFGQVRQLTTSGTGFDTENKPGQGSAKKMS
jgi:hypothetical protein